ncbi:MYB DNA binding protein/ transcription factor-like protein, partial [Ochromonadaceae sp. CCMP2298]
WTEEEDELLKAAVEQHGMGAWKQVALELPSRSSQQCMQRWRRSLQCHESVVTGHWLPEEERLLFAAALVYGAPRLSDADLPHEEDQCREKWVGNLDPSINAGPYTAEEDDLLLATSGPSLDAAGVRWVHVARCMPGRTDASTRSRWSRLTKQK